MVGTSSENLLTPESDCLVAHKADSKKVERHILNVKRPENLNNISTFHISIGKCSVRKKRLASQKRASACDSVESADARAECVFHKVDIIRVSAPSAYLSSLFPPLLFVVILHFYRHEQ